MTPTVIADSDGEESEADRVSPGPISVNCTLGDPTVQGETLSDGMSLPSASTDPQLFRRVFVEQQKAAQQRVLTQTNIISEGGIEADSSVADHEISFDMGMEQMRTGGQGKSLWDVPSSPEMKKPKGRRKRDQLPNTRTKITRGLRRQLDDIGYTSQEDDEAQVNDECHRKRRRVDETHEVHTASDDLVSTLPVESTATFMVAPTTLTSSQREEYSSAKVGENNSPGRPQGQRSLYAASSGTATNLNTPRSENRPSSATPLCSGISHPGDEDILKLSSSVTVGSLKPDKGTPYKESDSTKSLRKRMVLDSDEDNEALMPARIRQDDSDDDHGSDAGGVTKPVNAEKQRVRSKKAQNESAANNAKKPDARVKRKRGRPKKCDGMASVDLGDGQDTSQPVKDAGAEQDANKAAADGEDGRHRSKSPATPQQESEAQSHASIREEPSTPNTKKNSNSSTDDWTGNENKQSGVKNPLSTTASAGRPLYRVGLSKKTRIAPLLKMIRK